MMTGLGERTVTVRTVVGRIEDERPQVQTVIRGGVCYALVGAFDEDAEAVVDRLSGEPSDDNAGWSLLTAYQRCRRAGLTKDEALQLSFLWAQLATETVCRPPAILEG